MRKTGLVILDGWGIADDPSRSAINQAKTPFVDSLDQYPHSTLVTYGSQVGLPDGQMGNSEVGHLNIGAGRVVYQDLAKINKAIKEDTLKENDVLKKMIDYAVANDKPVHLMGLVSDGGVHSHIDHLIALVNIIDQSEVSSIYLHAFMDGRDTSPNGGLNYINTLQSAIADTKATLVSMVGRYYAMDRDNRWERIEKAYNLLVKGQGEEVSDFSAFLEKSYADGVTDEFILPATLAGSDSAMKDEDAVLFYNYRGDRPRQITRVLTQNAIEGYDMQPLNNLFFAAMTTYDASFKGLHILFTKENLKNTLGEVVSAAGLTQVRIAETEKYPHVTFFFNGGREEAFEREDRILINSPKVATYDLQPEMSAYEVTDAITDRLNADNRPDFFCLNYANTDMVGHTGIIPAAVSAVEHIDTCLKKLVDTALDQDYDLIVIADHGNSDIIVNEDGSPHTAHTTNLVPVWYISNDPISSDIKAGKLGDVSPTILKLMGLDAPAEMDGEVLF
jgi:2,3-bisphosphoglycerate-independent phosphoglycerate mutase